MKWMLLAAGILFWVSGPTQVAAHDLEPAEVEQIVRDYLLREPEVIYEAIQEFQRRQELAETQQRREMLTSRAGELFDDSRDPIANAEGDVTLVEFFDYRCGYCRSMTDGIEQLVQDDANLKLVFKEFPILGEESIRASRAALAAHKQGGYEAMHFALMRARDLSIDGIRELAVEHGLDPDQLVLDMESEEVAQHIADNLELARSLGINGTPTFVIDEQVIPGAIPIDRLRELVAELREAG